MLEIAGELKLEKMVQFFTRQIGDVLFGDSQAGTVLNGALLDGIAVGLHPPQDRLQGPELLSDRSVPVFQHLNIPLGTDYTAQ